ncbi:MAG: serine/threonine protein kinase, partial [Myxococcaceae bacterium]|nr:serine/threonine protein kinase [Myxococcaceae bacterium]
VKPPEIQGVLKLMSSDLTEHEEFRTRFLDEVRVLAQLDHPNIVKVFDYDKLPDGTPFYVMELLHGRTVRDVLATMGTLPPRVAFEVTRQLCEALHCAHTHDIPVVHRDIKPENIFLHAPRHGEPQVKLIDFGVIAVADRAHDGAFVGTWKYAAPEQIRGERATPATDIYAVGLVLYEMLSGIGPFEHLDSGSLVSQAHLREIPPPVSKFAPWVPPSIVQLIAASLAKEPRQRPRDAYAFAERLFELEWANDGKDPNDRTSEGPLSRILSTVRPSSRNMPAAAPNKDRLGNVPMIGVPQEARHGGPTIKGVGGAHEATSPDVDALLAGFSVKGDAPKKKARESGPKLEGEQIRDQVVIHPGVTGDPRVQIQGTPRMPAVVARPGKQAPHTTLDAPAEAPSTRGAQLAAQTGAAASHVHDTDTFSSQESDTRRLPKRGNKLAVPIGIALLAAIGAVSFVAYRGRSTSTTPANVVSAPPIETGATTAAVAPVIPPPTPIATEAPTAVASAPATPSASVAKIGARAVPGMRAGKAAAAIAAPGAATPPATVATSSPGSTPAATTAAPPPPATVPKPADTSFVRGL